MRKFSVNSTCSNQFETNRKCPVLRSNLMFWKAVCQFLLHMSQYNWLCLAHISTAIIHLLVFLCCDIAFGWQTLICFLSFYRQIFTLLLVVYSVPFLESFINSQIQLKAESHFAMNCQIEDSVTFAVTIAVSHKSRDLIGTVGRSEFGPN